jgi:putative DNA modification/repair radical SAM protein
LIYTQIPCYSTYVLIKSAGVDNKLAALAEAARDDVCGCSRAGAIDTSPSKFIYHAALPDGGCTSLFKVLMTNVCTNDCAYCANRSNLDIDRTAFKPEELARLFMEFNRKKMAEGLFLSSGIAGNPSSTMSRMIETVELLRRTYQFKGYVHLKLLPGATSDCIEAACKLANRVSVNIEAPSAHHLSRLSSRKNLLDGILAPMRQVKSLKDKTPYLVPGGQTTQFVVGAAGETDRDILTTTQGLYKEIDLRRVYFSAYRPVGDDRLAGVPAASPWRQHRLYQTDWLLRVYNFTPGEVSLALDPSGYLPLKQNPKLSIARSQPWLYPVDVNRATYYELLRVPGIGPVSAGRIVEARKHRAIWGLEQLQKLHVRYREAAPYIWFKGMTDWEKQLTFLPDIVEQETEGSEKTLAEAVV